MNRTAVEIREWLWRHRWPLLVAFIVLNAFLRNAATPLWDQDEAAYAGFARHMLQSGDWVVPHFMWSDPHRKPPFLFWSIAVAFKLFGESEFALRLPTTLAMLGTFAAVWRLGGPVFGERQARLAALILATSLLLPNMGKMAIPDTWLLLFDTVAGLSLLNAIERPALRWTLLYWGAIALGLLTKGPPILVVAGGLFAWLALVHPGRKNLLRLHPWFGLPLACLPLLAWGWLAWHRTNGDLIRWMLNWYIFRRLRGGTVFGQVGPPGYHLLVMLVGLLPWSAFLWVALAGLRRRWREPQGRALVGWLIFGWMLWEFFRSKLPAYAIGAYPAVAMLLAGEIEHIEDARWSQRSVRFGFWVARALGIVLSIGLAAFAWRLHLGAVAFASAILMFGVVLFGAWRAQGKDTERLVATFAFGGLACSCLCWAGIMPAVDLRRDVGKAVAEAISHQADQHATVIYSQNFHLPSMPFYVGRSGRQQITASSRSELLSPPVTGSEDVLVMPDKTYRELKPGLPAQAVSVNGWVVDGLRQPTLWVVTMRAAPVVLKQ